jgi:hypothetical protein
LASAATHAVDLDGSLAGRLAAWRFNRADFATDTGVVPTTTNHVAIVSGADGAAVAFRATKGPSFLRYPLTGTNGGTLLNLTNGGFRLLYRPDWCSRTTETFQGMTWGVGPERWVRLLEVADASTNAPPLLALSIDPSGTNLVLQSRDPQGRIRTNFVSPLRWLFRKKEVDPKGGPQWHEVLVSYTPTNSIVVINGMARDDLLSRKPQGPGIASPAPAGAASLLIGGSQNGSASAEGALDELETFGRPLTPLDSYARRDQFTLLARVSASPPQVDLRWHGIWFEPVEIRRRRLGDTQWQTLAKDFLGLSFSDRSPELEVGFLYEYAVGRRTTVVALNARPQGARGCVLLLVDRTVARPLERELAQFRADLVGDGWQVARQTVPRHDDEAWRTQRINPRYIADVNEVKSRILAACSAASNELKAVVLIGHVTIPFSGVQREDGHIERNGAWPADSFYGDIDGRWSDAAMDTGTNVMDRVLANVPGDGKLDPWLFNDHIDTPSGRHGVEVAVGRIDFARLPAYQPASETDLLRRYFDKNHRYRHKELAFDRRSIAGDYFLTPFDDYGVVTQHDSFSAASRLAGLEGLEFGNLFADGNSYLFGVLGGFGAPDVRASARPNWQKGVSLRASPSTCSSARTSAIGTCAAMICFAPASPSPTPAWRRATAWAAGGSSRNWPWAAISARATCGQPRAASARAPPFCWAIPLCGPSSRPRPRRRGRDGVAPACNSPGPRRPRPRTAISSSVHRPDRKARLRR